MSDTNDDRLGYGQMTDEAEAETTDGRGEDEPEGE